MKSPMRSNASGCHRWDGTVAGDPQTVACSKEAPPPIEVLPDVASALAGVVVRTVVRDKKRDFLVPIGTSTSLLQLL